MLYHGRRHELGCPRSLVCVQGSKAEDCSPERDCTNFLGPAAIVEELPDRPETNRVRFLTRVESLLTIGVTIRLDDLSTDVWTDLFALTLERQRMDRLMQKARDRKDRRARGETEIKGVDKAKLAKARAEGTMPAPGGTLFPQRRPIR